MLVDKRLKRLVGPAPETPGVVTLRHVIEIMFKPDAPPPWQQERFAQPVDDGHARDVEDDQLRLAPGPVDSPLLGGSSRGAMWQTSA